MSLFSDVLGYSLSAIFSLESAIPEPGVGTTKKQIVLSGVDAILKASAFGMNATGHKNIGTILLATGAFIDSTVCELKKAKVGPFAPPVAPVVELPAINSGP